MPRYGLVPHARSPLRNAHLFPNAALFFPVVKRLAVVMDFDQIEREIFATILDVKPSVARFFGVVDDVFLNSSRDIGLLTARVWNSPWEDLVIVCGTC
jgi:hypothetical protein